MAKRTITYLSIAALLFTTACSAAQPGLMMYEPVVDLDKVSGSKYQSDLAKCYAYADQVDPIKDALLGTVGGGLLGGALGSALGAMGAGAGRGAAIGATVGGMGLGAKQYGSAYQRQITIIDNCLRGRGYKVLG